MKHTSDGAAIAIDVGGTYTKIALVSRLGEVIGCVDEMRTASTDGVDDYFTKVVRHCEDIRGRPGGVRGIGLSMPGFLDDDLETVVYNPNTPALVGFPYRRELAAATGLDVHLEVDCNAAALAEYRFGAGRFVRRLVVMSLGTGVGVGALIEGAVVRLTGGCAGDIGHVFVGGEERCSAGCKGCLESEVSIAALSHGFGLPERLRSLEPPDAVRALIESAKAGDAASIAVLRRAGAKVGLAVSILSTLLLPDLVLLAGGIAEAGDLLVDSAQRAFRECAAPYFQVEIRRGAFGATAGLMGAAAALFEATRTHVGRTLQLR